MATKSPEDVLCAFEHYQKDLNQLLEALKSGGKSGAAVSLMQSLTAQDIGMLCWSVPADWQSATSDFHGRFEAALNGIQTDVAVLRSDFAAAEGGLPTLSMLADQIAASASRVTGTKPATVPSSQSKTRGPSPSHKLFTFLKGLFSRRTGPKRVDPNQPITIDSTWSPGTKLELMSYTEAMTSLRSGEHARMAEAIGSNILNAPGAYNDISTSLASSPDESLTNILLPLLKHEEYRVRCCIPAILEEIGDYSVIPHLEEVIQHDPDKQVVKNARIAVEKIKSRGVATDSVKFLRTYAKPISSPPGGAAVTGTYDEYTAPNKVVARAFLDKKTVTKDYDYIEIITPEGNLGKDKMGIY